MWDAQLLRSIILELGLTKETANEKQRTKLQRIIALRELKSLKNVYGFLKNRVLMKSKGTITVTKSRINEINWSQGCQLHCHYQSNRNQFRILPIRHFPSNHHSHF